jgi:hypothetical protein
MATSPDSPNPSAIKSIRCSWTVCHTTTLFKASAPTANISTSSIYAVGEKAATRIGSPKQAFIERTRLRQETPGELVRDFDATEVNHAALQLGTLHIFEALRDLGPGSLNQKLGGDCAAFARLINALARASKETMQLQKYREACARARRMLDQLKDPKRKLTDDERRSIVLQVDDILGLGGEPEPLEVLSPIPELQSPKSKAQSPIPEVQSPTINGQSPEEVQTQPPEEVQSPMANVQGPERDQLVTTPI